MRSYRSLSVLALTAIALPAAPSTAQESAEDRLSAAARQYFTDVQLITQNGDTVRLYSDLLKDKVVVINAFFGTCKGACPKMAGVLEGLQGRLGGRLGKDVFFLSFSVDPETDTPAKLKAYADQFHAKTGWFFLSGKKESVDFALAKLGQKAARKEDHLTIFLVGNNRTGLWKKVLGTSSTAESLKAVVDSVLNDKG